MKKKNKIKFVFSFVSLVSLTGISVEAKIVMPYRTAKDFCNQNTDVIHFENELEIGKIYDYVNYVPIYDDGKNKTKEGKYIDVKWITYDWISYKHITWSDYISLPRYIYSIYQVGVVDAPYWSEIPKLYYSDFTSEINFSVSSTKSDTYEHSLKSTLSNEFGGKLYIESAFQVGDVFTTKYEEKLATTHEIVASNARSEKVKIWGDGYYCSQRRATYKMYIVLAFEAEYNKTERIEKVIWHNDRIYTHTLKGYRYKGKSLQFEYSGSCYEALSRYLFDDFGNLYYEPK